MPSHIPGPGVKARSFLVRRGRAGVCPQAVVLPVVKAEFGLVLPCTSLALGEAELVARLGQDGPSALASELHFGRACLGLRVALSAESQPRVHLEGELVGLTAALLEAIPSVLAEGGFGAPVSASGSRWQLTRKGPSLRLFGGAVLGADQRPTELRTHALHFLVALNGCAGRVLDLLGALTFAPRAPAAEDVERLQHLERLDGRARAALLSPGARWEETAERVEFSTG